MQFKHAPAVVSAVFDDPHLVSAAGLVPMLRLAHAAGLERFAQDRLSIPTDGGSNAGAKVMALVAGMLARRGGFPSPADRVRANTRRDSGTQESPLTDRC